MKRGVCLFVATAMLVAGAGCNGKNSDTGNGKGDGKYTTAAIGSEFAGDIKLSNLKNKEISMMANVDSKFFQDADKPDAPNSTYHTMKVWKETYGVDVKIETVEWDSYTSYLSTAAASGQTPDIIAGGPLWYPRWPANNLTKPLDNYLDLNDKMYNKAIMDQLKWDNKYHVAFSGIPEKTYIAYNKTKFLAAGEKTPLELWQEGKWNWTQFVKTAKAMTDEKNGDFGFSSWYLGPTFCPYPIASMGSDNKVQLNIDSANYMRWMTEVYNLYQKDKGARCDWDLGNWRETFPAGKDAMVMCTPVEYVRILQRVEVTGGDEFGIAPVPVFDPTGETKAISSATIYGLSISGKAKNPEGAAEFIRLTYKISENINKKFGEFGLIEKYVTPEEKEMLEKVKDDPTVFEVLSGIGKSKKILDENISFKMYNQLTTESVKSLLDQTKPLLQAEIDEFYKALGK